MSHKSEMAGLFNRGDTLINKHFTFLLYYAMTLLVVMKWVIFCHRNRHNDRHHEVDLNKDCFRIFIFNRNIY